MRAATLQVSWPFVEHRTLTYDANHGVPLVNPAPRILVIDDSPLFCWIFTKMARRYDLPVKTFESFKDFSNSSRLDYDLAVLDYDLGECTGIDVAKYIEKKIGNIPVLITSYTDRNSEAEQPWPAIVRGFSGKAEGVEAVINDALKLFAVSKKRKFLRLIKRR